MERLTESEKDFINKAELTIKEFERIKNICKEFKGEVISVLDYPWTNERKDNGLVRR